jgi:hypothetical protein
MKFPRWRWLFIGLLVWFYGGTAYLQWILPARFSGFQESPRVVVVSPTMDRILAADVITLPLLALSMAPVRCLSFFFLHAAGADSGHYGDLSDAGKKAVFFTDALSSAIWATAVIFFLKLAAHEIRQASDHSKARKTLEEIRQKKAGIPSDSQNPG